MEHLDNTFVENTIRRIKSIPDDAVPQWGTLRKNTLIEHLIWAVKHSMGRSTQVPINTNFFLQYIAGPLIINRILPMPKNVKLPKHLTDGGVSLLEPGDLETLHALLEDYIALAQTGELKTALHPGFGDIGVDGWSKLHVIHFEHHMKQFGV